MSSRLRTLSRARSRSTMTKNLFQEEQKSKISIEEESVNGNVVFIDRQKHSHSDIAKNSLLITNPNVSCKQSDDIVISSSTDREKASLLLTKPNNSSENSDYSESLTHYIVSSSSSYSYASVCYNKENFANSNIAEGSGIGYITANSSTDKIEHSILTRKSQTACNEPVVAQEAKNSTLEKIISAPFKAANAVTRINNFVDSVVDGDLLSEPVLVMGAAGLATAAVVCGVAINKMNRANKSRHEQQLTLQKSSKRKNTKIELSTKHEIYDPISLPSLNDASTNTTLDEDKQRDAHNMQESINQRLANSRMSLLQYVEKKGLNDTIPEPFSSLRTDQETGQMYDPVSRALYDAENDVFVDPETGLVWDLNCQPPCLFQWKTGMTITDMIMKEITIPKANLWKPPPYFLEDHRNSSKSDDSAKYHDDSATYHDDSIKYHDDATKYHDDSAKYHDDSAKYHDDFIYIGQAREQLTCLLTEIRQHEAQSKQKAKRYKKLDWVWFIIIIIVGGIITLIEITRTRSNNFTIILSVLAILLKAGHMAFQPSSRSTRYNDAETQFGKVCDEINEAKSVLRTSRDIVSYITAVRGQVREIKRVVFNEGTFDVSSRERRDNDPDNENQLLEV